MEDSELSKLTSEAIELWIKLLTSDIDALRESLDKKIQVRERFREEMKARQEKREK